MAEQSFHLLAEEIKSTRTVIMEAYKSQNFRMLKAIAHKMKGAFGYCGLPHNDKKEIDQRRCREAVEALDEAEKAYQIWYAKERTHN